MPSSQVCAARVTGRRAGRGKEDNKRERIGSVGEGRKDLQDKQKREKQEKVDESERGRENIKRSERIRSVAKERNTKKTWKMKRKVNWKIKCKIEKKRSKAEREKGKH